jgi:hypothetical protein
MKEDLMEQTALGQSPIQYQSTQANLANKTNGSTTFQPVRQTFNIDDKAKMNSTEISSSIKSLANKEAEKLPEDNVDENQSRRRRRRTNNGCGLFGNRHYSRRTGLYR